MEIQNLNQSNLQIQIPEKPDLVIVVQLSSVQKECYHSRIVKGYNKNSENQYFCVKVINNDDSIAEELLVQQYNIFKKIPKHPNIINCLFKPVVAKVHSFLIFEYFQSCLFDEIKTQVYSQQEIFSMFRQIISGYRVLYDRNILHQNICPKSIYKKGNLYKLAGFEFSVFYEDGQILQQKQGEFRYIAPQKIIFKQYKGNPKSDVYSLGILMYEMIMGVHPYLGQNIYSPYDSKQSRRNFIDRLKQCKTPTYASPPYHSEQFSKLFLMIRRMINKSYINRIGYQEIYQYSKGNIKRELVCMDINQNLNNKEINPQSIVSISPKNNIKAQELDGLSQKQREILYFKIKQFIDKILEISTFLTNLVNRFNINVFRQIENQAKLVVHLVLFSKHLISDLIQDKKDCIIFTQQQWKTFEQLDDQKLSEVCTLQRERLEKVQNQIRNRGQLTQTLKDANIVYGQKPFTTKIKVLGQVLDLALASMTEWMDIGDQVRFTIIPQIIASIKLLQTFGISDKKTRHSIMTEYDQKSSEQLIQYIAQYCEERNIFYIFNQGAI